MTSVCYDLLDFSRYNESRFEADAGYSRRIARTACSLINTTISYVFATTETPEAGSTVLGNYFLSIYRISSRGLAKYPLKFSACDLIALFFAQLDYFNLSTLEKKQIVKDLIVYMKERYTRTWNGPAGAENFPFHALRVILTTSSNSALEVDLFRQSENESPFLEAFLKQAFEDDMLRYDEALHDTMVLLSLDFPTTVYDEFSGHIFRTQEIAIGASHLVLKSSEAILALCAMWHYKRYIREVLSSGNTNCFAPQFAHIYCDLKSLARCKKIREKLRITDYGIELTLSKHLSMLSSEDHDTSMILHLRRLFE